MLLASLHVPGDDDGETQTQQGQLCSLANSLLLLLFLGHTSSLLSTRDVHNYTQIFRPHTRAPRRGLNPCTNNLLSVLCMQLFRMRVFCPGFGLRFAFTASAAGVFNEALSPPKTPLPETRGTWQKKLTLSFACVCNNARSAPVRSINLERRERERTKAKNNIY